MMTYRVQYTTAYGESSEGHTSKDGALKAARKIVNGFLRGVRRHLQGQHRITVMVYEEPAFRVVARYRVSRDRSWD